MCYIYTFQFLFNGQTNIIEVLGYDNEEGWDSAIYQVKEDFNINDEALIKSCLTLIKTEY